jgi:hypothetical protein
VMQRLRRERKLRAAATAIASPAIGTMSKQKGLDRSPGSTPLAAPGEVAAPAVFEASDRPDLRGSSDRVRLQHLGTFGGHFLAAAGAGRAGGGAGRGGGGGAGRATWATGCGGGGGGAGRGGGGAGLAICAAGCGAGGGGARCGGSTRATGGVGLAGAAAGFAGGEGGGTSFFLGFTSGLLRVASRPDFACPTGFVPSVFGVPAAPPPDGVPAGEVVAGVVVADLFSGVSFALGLVPP